MLKVVLYCRVGRKDEQVDLFQQANDFVQNYIKYKSYALTSILPKFDIKANNSYYKPKYHYN